MSVTKMSSKTASIHKHRNTDFVDSDTLRTKFALAMSAMYKKEVPLYSDLIGIVQDVNNTVLSEGASHVDQDEIQRLALERHGAVRLGTAVEAHTIRRMFNVLGMSAVDYYDLSVAGLPMHATCFRPTQASSLSKNPFRVFTTLLRPELLESRQARELALDLLAKRDIFSDELKALLDIAEGQAYRLSHSQATPFIVEALRTFSWQPFAQATQEQHQFLSEEHPILADIACFSSAHINHLTPRTLDIDAAQRAMKAAGMDAKSVIEGPPKRNIPILLRQTSFLALSESVQFKVDASHEKVCYVPGQHRARFGEIEERGAALTQAGRRLYDNLHAQATSKESPKTGKSRAEAFAETFQEFPDNWSLLRQQGLVYCSYKYTGNFRHLDYQPRVELDDSDLLKWLLKEGFVEARPIVYEDFLPFSAAGIFQSNLAKSPEPGERHGKTSKHDQDGLELVLGCPILSSSQLYASEEMTSAADSIDAWKRQGCNPGTVRTTRTNL